jgi:hypothetical protein
MPEYSSRSNDPRITGGLKGMNASDYEMALEVARQPADTASRKKQRKRAENYARAFESRFQKEAYKLSNGNPISAGGPKGYKSPQKVKMNIKESKPKSSSVASKVGGAAGKVAGRAKTTAREARDVVTAVGTSARARLNTRSYRTASGGLKSTPTSKANTAAADKNLKKQIKETAMAAKTGKKGTTSAKTGGKPSKKRK